MILTVPTRDSVFGDRDGFVSEPRALGSSHALCAVRAYSSAWLERPPDKREVGSSNLPRPTTHEGGTIVAFSRGCSSAGRARALQA